jgi:hypothetical protein
MRFIKKLLSFFNFNSKKREIQEMRQSLFALEIKLAYCSKELFETQKILEKISEILAQFVLEQNAISAKVSIDNFESLEKSDYATMFDMIADDDDLLN